MRKSLLLLTLFCAACSNYSASLPSIKPYRMDISQGNIVTPKMMMQLRPGMSKAQVKFIMGTPLIVDAFHANRWDYFYQMRKDGKIVEQRRVIMDFENDKLARIRGDVIPAASASGETSDKPANKAPVTLKSTSDPKPKEKGLLDSLKFWGDDEPAAKPETAPVAEPAKPAAAPEAVKAAPPAEVAAPAAAPAPAEAPAAEAAAAEAAAPAPEPPAPEVVPVPVAEPKAAPAPAPEPQAVAPAPRSESSGAQIRLQPKPQQAPLPVIEPKPVTKAAPVGQPARDAVKAAPPAEVAAPAAATASAPAEKTLDAPVARPRSSEAKPLPKPADDLPPEDAPDYFERMLEKIGF